MLNRLAQLWLKLRVKWSNLYIKKHNCINNVDVNTAVYSIEHLATISGKLYNNFVYKADDVTQLFDVMRTPAQCYIELHDDILYDDCDGYHAALYHLAHANNIKCYLLTYITRDIKNSHTFLVAYKSNNYVHGWIGIDYKNETVLYKSIGGLIRDKTSKYKILGYNLVQFNYVSNEWEIVDMRGIEDE